jgi:hypothetical protein
VNNPKTAAKIHVPREVFEMLGLNKIAAVRKTMALKIILSDFVDKFFLPKRL